VPGVDIVDGVRAAVGAGGAMDDDVPYFALHD
jgi:hypothetical protein